MRILVSEKLSPHKMKTPEGYLICTDAILSRTGKQTYRRSEIWGDTCDNAEAEVEVDRKPEEVFNDKTLASFENKPICIEHPDEDVNVNNHNQLSVGFVRDIRRGKVDGQDVMLGTLVITDADAVEAVERGDYTELSCGYNCDVVDEDNPQQRNIRGNHVALCERGRAGIARIVDTADDLYGLVKEPATRYFLAKYFDEKWETDDNVAVVKAKNETEAKSKLRQSGIKYDSIKELTHAEYIKFAKITKVIDSIKDGDFSKQTKQGYQVLEMYRDGGRLHVIFKRANDFGIGLGYDTTDGQWSQGRYDFSTLEKARQALMEEKPYARRIQDSNTNDLEFSRMTEEAKKLKEELGMYARQTGSHKSTGVVPYKTRQSGSQVKELNEAINEAIQQLQNGVRDKSAWNRLAIKLEAWEDDPEMASVAKRAAKAIRKFESFIGDSDMKDIQSTKAPGTDKIIYVMQSDVDKNLYFYIGKTFAMKEGAWGYTKFEMGNTTPEQLKAELTRNGWHAVSQGVARIIDAEHEVVTDEIMKDESRQTLIEKLRTVSVPYGERYALTSGSGWHIDIQHHGQASYENINKYPHASPKESSKATIRLWYNGKHMKTFEGPLNSAKSDAIRYLQTRTEDSWSSVEEENYKKANEEPLKKDKQLVRSSSGEIHVFKARGKYEVDAYNRNNLDYNALQQIENKFNVNLRRGDYGYITIVSANKDAIYKAFAAINPAYSVGSWRIEDTVAKDSKEQLFTIEYKQGGTTYIRKVRANSITDAISKVKDDAHKVVVFTNQVLNELGKNNSIGKYDRVVQAMRSLYSESLLPDDKLKELIRKKVPEYIKKYVKE